MKSLVKILEDMLSESEASSSEISLQRERNHRYYSMQPIGNEIKGRSQYISPDVLDSVESKKALYAETFFSGRQVVKFRGDNKQDAEQRTAYVDHQLALNNVYELFRDGWHDAFVAKKMTVVADWKADTEDVTIELEGATQRMFMAILEQQEQENGPIVGVDQTQLQPQQQQQQPPQQQPGMQPQPQPEPTFSGPVTISFDRSRVDLKLIQPERVYGDPNASYVRDGQFFTYEEEVSRGELIELGFDPDQVEKLTNEYRFGAGSEDAGRKAHDGSGVNRATKRRVDEQELVCIYRTMCWLDLAEHGYEGEGYQLYKICWVRGEILNYEGGEPAIKPIPELPVFEWTEYKISHAESGMSDADLTSHTQKVQSTLKRLIIDNQQMRNTSRYEAVVGAVKNPRELLDNSIGGTVWTKQPGSIAPLATPELSPLTLSVIQMLDMDKESRSGQSSLSKGMNMGAVNNQNSADMIDRLTNAGQRRVMRGARDFALTFMIPLCQFIYKLGTRHDQRTHNLEVMGKYEVIEPGTWPDEEVSMEVAVALTPDECEQHGKALLGLYQLQSQDEDLKLGFGYKQKHNLLSDIYDCVGVPDSSAYLLRPDDPEYQKKQQFQAQQMQQHQQQQQQMEQMQQQQQQMAAQMAEKQAAMELDKYQFQQWLDKSDDGRQWQKLELEKSKADVSARNVVADNIRADDEFEWNRAKDVAEIQLEAEQERPVAL